MNEFQYETPPVHFRNTYIGDVLELVDDGLAICEELWVLWVKVVPMNPLEAKDEAVVEVGWLTDAAVLRLCWIVLGST